MKLFEVTLIIDSAGSTLYVGADNIPQAYEKALKHAQQKDSYVTRYGNDPKKKINIDQIKESDLTFVNYPALKDGVLTRFFR